MNIGILGGTFDPIHIGHLHIAEAAAREYGLDKIWLMPAGNPYFKAGNSVSCPELRLAMTKACCSENSLFECCETEIHSTGDTHTADTLIKLKDIYTEHNFWFIMGFDSLCQLDKWYKPEIILKNAVILCALRESSSYDRSFDDVREYLCRIYRDSAPDIRLIHTPELNISSTTVRKLSAEGRDISEFVLPSVKDIIEKNSLYVSRM